MSVVVSADFQGVRVASVGLTIGVISISRKKNRFVIKNAKHIENKTTSRSNEMESFEYLQLESSFCSLLLQTIRTPNALKI